MPNRFAKANVADVKDQVTARTLYVSDLDGTLLTNDAIDRGILFSYATARSFSSSRRVTADLNLRVPLVTYGQR